MANRRRRFIACLYLYKESQNLASPPAIIVKLHAVRILVSNGGLAESLLTTQSVKVEIIL